MNLYPWVIGLLMCVNLVVISNYVYFFSVCTQVYILSGLG